MGGRQSMHHRANPGAKLKNTKHACGAHFYTIIYVGTREPKKEEMCVPKKRTSTLERSLVENRQKGITKAYRNNKKDVDTTIYKHKILLGSKGT